MMPGDDANPIFFNEKNKDWTLTSHPLPPITSHSYPLPPSKWTLCIPYFKSTLNYSSIKQFQTGYIS